MNSCACSGPSFGNLQAVSVITGKADGSQICRFHGKYGFVRSKIEILSPQPREIQRVSIIPEAGNRSAMIP